MSTRADTRLRIAVLDDYHRQWFDREEYKRFAEHGEVTIYTEPAAGPEETVSRLAGHQLVVALRERTRFDASLLARLADVECIVQTGGHTYHIDLDAATRHGIAVCLMPGGGDGGVGTAELTFGMLIGLFRGITRYDALMRRGGWEVPYGRALKGKVLGIVGAGRIAKVVARLGGAFGMRVIAWSPTLTPERAQAMGAEAVSLDDVFKQADAVTIHVPLKPETIKLVDARLLSLMKPDAVLINTSRGAIVDEDALLEVLREGRIAGAGLDVFSTEPLPADHPFRQLPNTILTPHAGWPTDGAYQSFVRSTAAMLDAFLSGNAQYVINPDALKHPRHTARGAAFGLWKTS